MLPATLSFLIASFNAIIGATSLVLALLYMMGLQHCKHEGKTIMRAIVAFWAAFAVYSFGLFYFNLLKFLQNQLCSDPPHLWFQLILNTVLMLTIIYYMWATIRRNPPKVEESPAGMLRDARQKQ